MKMFSIASEEGLLCPCQSGQAASECCAPYVANTSNAPTAEALMRSRYVAYTRRDSAYLLKTWHPSARPQQLNFEDEDDTQWINLTIVSTKNGGVTDSSGEVVFKAQYFRQGRVEHLAECSRFERVEGVWCYVDGDLLKTPTPTKVRRNDSCPCGSGRKFKRCCGRHTC